jgi:glycosyltransferase involved in cell wall biosynthesis
MELVSTIIPAFNAEKYLRESVDSALSQNYHEQEVIVVDDGSTDSTPLILAEYGNKIRVVRQPNKGSPAACNKGVEVARGSWISFLDADDIWLPDKLSKQLQVCGRTDISHTDSLVFGDSVAGEIRRSTFEPPYSGMVLKELLVRNFISKSTVLMRRDLYRQYGGFDESYTGVEDWPFWIKICARHELGYLPEALVRYRVHLKSKSMEGRKTLVDHMRIIEEAFGPNGAGRPFPHLKNKAIISSYQINSHYAAESGDWTFAARCTLLVLLRKPLTLYTWKRLIKILLIPFGVKY